jgi:hypothetical protein
MSFTLRNMAHVGQIKAIIHTGDITNAPTNGRVYLGIGGREFRLNKQGDQFKRNAIDTFVIGDGGNIDNPRNANDLPFVGAGTVNAPAIEYTDLGEYPKYIRLEPKEEDDDWNVESVNVEARLYIANTATGTSSVFTDLGGNVWLGNPFGKMLELHP